MIESIILGTIQGIFEWLPISSQGNLVLLMVGFLDIGFKTALNYAIFLHFGTFLAVLIYFWEDVIQIIKRLKKYRPRFDDEDDALISFLIISTILTGIIGYPIFKLIADFNFRGEIFLGLVGLALIFTGVLQKYANKKKKRKENKLTLKDSILFGILQGLALIPGVSRSGITVSAFLLRGYHPRRSLRLSFLMSIPVLFVGSIFLPIVEGFPDGIEPANLILGLIFAFIFGLITIKILLEIARKVKFWLFCVIIGLLALLPMIMFIF
jgi:undecaprenyl-diphosphatase